MRIRLITIAGLVMLGAALVGCGSGNDHISCQVVQGSYSDMVAVMDRWQYGNAANGTMLDALQELADDASGQAGIARTPEFKDAAGDVGTSARRVYQAVNSGVGFDSAAGELASASRSLNTLCAKWK